MKKVLAFIFGMVMIMSTSLAEDYEHDWGETKDAPSVNWSEYYTNIEDSETPGPVDTQEPGKPDLESEENMSFLDNAGLAYYDGKIQGQFGSVNQSIVANDIATLGNTNVLTDVAWTNGIYLKGDGTIGNNTSFQMTDNIPVSSGEKYVLSNKIVTGVSNRIGRYDSDGEFIDFLYHSEADETIGSFLLCRYTIPNGTASIRLSYSRAASPIVLYKGDTLNKNLGNLKEEIDSLDTTTLEKRGNVLLNSRLIISFDTAQSTLTIPKPSYLIIGKSRIDYENDDVVIDYSGVSGNIVTIVYRDNALTAIRQSTFNEKTDIALFSFAKNQLIVPATNNIFYPYYVDGVLYNASSDVGSGEKTVYVDGVNGSDSNDGTSARPFATITKGINSGANHVLVARGTYNETLTINNKENFEIIPASTPTFSTDTFDVPMIVVNRVLVTNSRDVHFLDIHASNPGSGNSSFVITRTTGAFVEHCWASNGQAGGFVTTNMSGKFLLCKAWNIGDSSHPNSDGFNLHGYGTTELIDCIAHDCYDDGISHHDGCVCSIKGGEFYNCEHGGGIAPVNRYCEIDGAYCHDNMYGIEVYQTDTTLYDPYILIKNSIMKNNEVYDIRCGAIKMDVLRCSFDTKSIDENAEYTEIE